MNYSSTIRVNQTYDIIVLGGGPAGCAAAAAAARDGAKTLIIEQSGMLGGMGTAGLVPAWCPFSDKDKVIYKGIAEKVFMQSKDASIHVPKDQVDWVPIDPEHLKVIYDRLMEEYMVDVLFNTMFLDTIMDEETVKAVIVANKEGLVAYQAKVFIDATGDADVAVKAGADYHIGEGDKKEPMPATLCFVITNVDMYAYEYHLLYGRMNGSMHPMNEKSFVHKLPHDLNFPNIKDTHLCHNVIGPSTVGFNSGHIFNVDATNPISVSQALILGRRIAGEFHDALKKYFPEAFAASYLVHTAPALGVRESRRIVGDYCLNVDDYLNRASFEDEICRNSYYLDIHYTETELEMLKRGEIEEQKRTARYSKGESHGIPYRSLIPQKIKNVLVAGRAISCDKQVQGSVRVMPVCLAMGEAAGIAAAMAIQIDSDVRKVDVASLRDKLKSYGVYIH